MDSEGQTGLILSEIKTWVAELERAVYTFEGSVARAEQRMNEVAFLEGAHNAQSGLQLLLTHALQSSHATEARVAAANRALSDALAQADFALQNSVAVDDLTPLEEGMLVCGGRYRVVRLLHRRPRVHLYLARRLTDLPLAGTGEYPLVVIRELVLSDLEPELSRCIERAAFEEFAAPLLFGTPHLPGVGDRTYLEHGRHYLIMQPRQARDNNQSSALLLSEMLFSPTRDNSWPHMTTALRWGTQLCQVVARQHRMQNVLGELTPDMLLVDHEGHADWAPLLLASWPPPPHSGLDQARVKNITCSSQPGKRRAQNRPLPHPKSTRACAMSAQMSTR